MKKLCLLLLSFLFCLSPIHAQKFIQIKDKAFNWGGKVGFSSTFPIINSLTINDVKAEDINMQYKVGYLASVFARVNIEHFFIQPNLSWRYAEGDIRFNIPEKEGDIPLFPNNLSIYSSNQIKYKTASIELPVMVGFYLVKEGPYALSMMIGPNIRYTYKSNYTTNMKDFPQEYTTDNTPFGVSIATGLGVSIWRLFLDFTYEFGINQVESDFKDRLSHLPTEGSMSIDRRTNAMSFSLGFLF